jgi:acetyl esterase/lipase
VHEGHSSCHGRGERLRAAGRDVQLTEYPNAQHGFDNPLSTAAPLQVKGAQTVRACQIAEEPKGVLINAVSKEPFTYKDACVQTNPHVNHDVEATRAARVAVKEVLRATFKLD